MTDDDPEGETSADCACAFESDWSGFEEPEVDAAGDVFLVVSLFCVLSLCAELVFDVVLCEVFCWSLDVAFVEVTGLEVAGQLGVALCVAELDCAPL